MSTAPYGKLIAWVTEWNIDSAAMVKGSSRWKLIKSRVPLSLLRISRRSKNAQDQIEIIFSSKDEFQGIAKLKHAITMKRSPKPPQEAWKSPVATNRSLITKNRNDNGSCVNLFQEEQETL